MSKFYDEIKAMSDKDEEEVKKTLEDNYIKSLADIKSKIMKYININRDLSYSKQMELKRLQGLFNEIDKRLKKLYDKNYDLIKEYDLKNWNREYFGLMYQVDKELGINLDFTMVNDKYIQEAIEYPVDGIPLSERLYKIHLKDMQKHTKEAVQQGMMQNKSYVEISKSIAEIGLVNMRKALLIAITEGGRIKSLSRQKAQEEAENKGVKLTKRWLATLDKKTRSDHQQLDGQEVGVDEEFHIHGYSAKQPRLFGVAKEDIHCRCDVITIVEGMAPKLRRDNETKEIINYKNYNEWLKNRVEK